MNILFEDDYIIVCEKPSGVPSQSDKTGDIDMINMLKNEIYNNTNKNNAYIGIIHRLDRPVGGIMVFSKSEFATKYLCEQMRKGEIQKQYLAVITGELKEKEGKLIDYLERNGKTNLSKITTSKNKNAKKAELKYTFISKANIKINDISTVISLIDIQLITGRHHQIRVQMAARGVGIWGDKKYNLLFQDEKRWIDIGLFAHRLEFKHPRTKKVLIFTLDPKGEIFEYLKKS